MAAGYPSLRVRPRVRPVMPYRQAVKDTRWQQAHEKLPEQELPEPCQQAFRAFEHLLRSRLPHRPRYFELADGSEVETYYPAYEAMKTESLAYAVFIAALLWILGLVPVSLLNVAAILLLPQAYAAPVVFGLYIIGGIVLLALLAPTVRDTWAHNRLKRAAPGPIGFGTYLLRDAIVHRFPGWAAYYPRERVHDVVIERVAARSSGGGKTPVRHHAAESYVAFRYLDALSAPKTTRFIHAAQAGHDPEPAQRLQVWIARDAAARADPSYGQVTSAELQRPEWAAAWRSFKRRRRVTHTLLIGPVLLVVVSGLLEHWITGGNFLDDALGSYSWALAFVLLLPGGIAWAVLRAFRCPRCGKWPRQPLSGTDVTRCLSCGLPIFTEVKGS